MKVKIYDSNTGQIIQPHTETIQVFGFQKIQFPVWGKGFSYSAIAGSTNEYNEKFTRDLYIQGAWYRPDSNADVRDYVDFEVVDLDNILGLGSGTVLDRYKESIPMIAGVSRECNFPDAAKVIAGIYFRVRYVSYGSSNVNLALEYYLRRA